MPQMNSDEHWNIYQDLSPSVFICGELKFEEIHFNRLNML